MKKKTSAMLLLSFSLLAWSFGVSPCWAQETITNSIQIPTSQFMILKTNNENLLLKLTELESNLATLENHSEKLAKQLETAKAQLQKSQQALAEANSSLANANALQQKTKESLQSLEIQLELEKEKQRDRVNKLKWQRNLYALLACALLAK